MFYKFENGEWLSGNEVHFPDGTVLNSENKESKDGWFWMDVSPITENNDDDISQVN